MQFQEDSTNKQESMKQKYGTSLKIAPPPDVSLLRRGTVPEGQGGNRGEACELQDPGGGGEEEGARR